MVSDTQILNRVTDATMYVCRVNYSNKGSLRYANELMEKNRLNNMVLVVNDVDRTQRGYGYYGYGYGYGYGRGYGYGYGGKDHKKKNKKKK